METSVRGRQRWKADKGWGCFKLGDVEAGLTATCISPPTKVCSSNGFGDLNIQPNHFHAPIAAERPGSPTPPGLVSTKGQCRTQSSFLQRRAGKGQLAERRAGGLPSAEGHRAISHPAAPDDRSTVDRGIAGDLWVLLFADIKDHREGKAGAEDGYSSEMVGTDAGTRLRQVRHRRDCSTSKGSSSKTMCCA